MNGHHVREDLARVCRVLAHHRMIDLWEHASLRVPRSDVVLVTPRFGRELVPRTLTARDLLVCDMDGRLIEGRGELPLQFAVDAALYREGLPGRSACIFGSPHAAMAAGIARRALLPLTHMESAVGHGMATWDAHTLAVQSDSAASLAQQVARASAVQQPGIGVWAGGSDIYDALMNLYHLEYLAQANVVAAAEPSMRTLCAADWEKLWRQFSGHAHYIEFFDALDPGPLAHPYLRFLSSRTPGRTPHETLKAQLAFSCRALCDREPAPSYRVGLDIGTRRPPRYGRCDLIVDPEVRRATLDALSDGPVVHEIGHGTDFVASTLEQATVDAIQREAFLAMDHLAQRLGGARPLPDSLAADIRAAEPSAEDWWWFYAAEVGAPRRSAAGI